MSLALNSKPASQKESINMVQPKMTPSAQHSCSWKTIFYSAFLLYLCMCPQRIENHCIYSVSRWGPTRVLWFVRWIQISCLSSFYTFILFSPLCFYTLFSVAARSGQGGTFLLRLLLSLSSSFHIFGLSHCCCLSLSSRGHLPCIHASHFVCWCPKGQVSRYCSLRDYPAPIDSNFHIQTSSCFASYC